MSKVVIQKAGPLPISVNLPWPSTNTVLVAVSGSVWSKVPNAMVGMSVTIHGEMAGKMQLYANDALMHVALPTGFYAVHGDFSSTTITLAAANPTTVGDSNDTFTVALIY